MPTPTRLCQRYEAGTTLFSNGLHVGQYLAAVTCEVLPRAVNREGHVVTLGWAAGFGQWLFFEALEPALACGRAARMSMDCRGYGVYEAAHEQLFCTLHHQDERVLLVAERVVHSEAEEVEILKRFVQGVKEHPWSSYWNAPTGYITAYNDGTPVKTAVRSLPL